MRRYRRHLACCLAVIGGVLSGCNPEETGVIADPAFEGVTWVQRGVGVEYTIENNGVRSSILIADTAYSYGINGQDSTVVVGMLLQVFDAQGVVRATVNADGGWMHPFSKQMIARGSAELEIPALERVIHSENMYFDYSGVGSARSDLFTRMVDVERTICGTGFQSNLEFTDTQVFEMRTGQAQCGG